MGDDVRDILDIDQGPEVITKDMILGTDKKQKLLKKKSLEFPTRKPEGMCREVFALLCSDKKDVPSLIMSDTTQGYKQMKAKLGMRKVRPWRWMPFVHPARKDGAALYHWKRIADEGKEYPFAKFNKVIQVPTYSEPEYLQHLQADNWTQAETDHLFDLCRRFDLRFTVMQDRWDRTQFPDRSVEDMKERYYDICNILSKARTPAGQEMKVRGFDAEHERRRKEQMRRLFDRTPEQIEEEQNLFNELKKIETRKKEREKKTQDLQKLITAADSNSESRRQQERKLAKKKTPVPQKIVKQDPVVIEAAGIKFPDLKTSGASLRSQRIKLPQTVGQKKIKAIEQLLTELGLELNPVPTEEICTHFNELRSDMVLLYELKLAHANCEFELQTLRHQYEAMLQGKVHTSPRAQHQQPPKPTDIAASPIKLRANSSEFIDVVGSPGAGSSSNK